MLNQNDPLLVGTCPIGGIDGYGTANLADTTDIVGRLLYPMQFQVRWNVVADHPQTGLKTIRMFIDDPRTSTRVLTADFIRWR